MKNMLKNRRLWVLVIVVIIVFIGIRIKNQGGLGIVLSSKNEDQVKETTFVQVAKQFALTVPAKWSITEPVSGKQTLIYPAETKISGTDVQVLLNQDVIIVETATNKKESFAALMTEMQSTLEKNGSTVTVEEKDFGSLKGSKLTVTGKTNYQQLFFNTPTIIIVTAKVDHTIFDDLAKSVTIDISNYANDIAQVTNLTRQTKQDIASGNFSGIYKSASNDLKKLKSEEEFSNLLKDVSVEFNNNVLIWGIFINSKGLGSAVNIVNQDKITRRGSFYYLKNKNQYFLDAIRISGKITYSETATPN